MNPFKKHYAPIYAPIEDTTKPDAVSNNRPRTADAAMYAVCRRESLYKTPSPGSSRQSPAGYKQLAWPWLPHSGFLQQAVIEEFDTAMNVPKTSRRLIRPSSAAANLQVGGGRKRKVLDASETVSLCSLGVNIGRSQPA